MTLIEWRKTIENTLSAATISNVQLETKWLLSNALKKDAAFVVLNPEYQPAAHEEETIEAWLKRRLQEEPLSRIKGEREFWSLPFYIDEYTLDPRPETELIVEEALKWVGKKMGHSWRILDLGTGSGCILISLLHELKNAEGTGIDISRDALTIAQKNAERHNVRSRSHFIENDWAEGIEGKFDIIVSNPPYIPTFEEATLEKSVRCYDPHAALFGGEDGLYFYRKLANEIRSIAALKSILIIEFGKGQRKAIEELFIAADFQTLFVVKDLAGIERVAGFRV